MENAKASPQPIPVASVHWGVEDALLRMYRRKIESNKASIRSLEHDNDNFGRRIEVVGNAKVKILEKLLGSIPRDHPLYEGSRSVTDVEVNLWPVPEARVIRLDPFRINPDARTDGYPADVITVWRWFPNGPEGIGAIDSGVKDRYSSYFRKYVYSTQHDAFLRKYVENFDLDRFIKAIQQ